MTTPKTQIQALINKIDEVLHAAESPRERSQPPEDEHQQHVLEQARNYLASLQGSPAPTLGGSPERVGSPSLPAINPPPQAGASHSTALSAGLATPAESAQQVLQAVVQEMNYLRVNMMQPLREELMALYQQRQMLSADIQRLEQQRYQLLLSQQQFDQQQAIQDFLQSLMGRLQEQLAAQIAQTYANLELQASQLPPDSSSEQPQLTPGQRLQHMQQLQSQSDEVMLKLDSTLRVVFDSLQTNVDSYQDSLIQGLEKMHSLGQQGEAMFAALVNRFAEQLGRGASYYLQSSLQKEWELPGLGSVEGPDGALMPRQPVQSEDQVSVPDEVPEDQLNRMISTLATASNEAAADTFPGLDDGLIDELLGNLGADASQGIDGADFDLSDVELPTTDISLDDVSFGSEPADNEGDRSASVGEELTLFEIGDDGVHTHLEEERITQIQESDTDSFLDNLNAVISPDDTLPQDGAIEDIVESRPPSAHEEDEALAFLDQVATEMESDLESTLYQEQTQPPADFIEDDALDQSLGIDELFDSGDNSDATDAEKSPIGFPGSEQAQTEPLLAGEPPSSAIIDSDIHDIEALIGDSDSSEDEVDDIYLMFDSASGDSPPSQAEESPDLPTESTPSEVDVSHPIEDGAEGEIGLLNGLFGEVNDEFDDPSIRAFNVESAEASPDTDDDLFSELGMTLQDSPQADAADTPDHIETITSLTDLVDDAESRTSIEAKSHSVDIAPDANPFQFDDSAPGQYIVASPDEDLLATEESDQRIDVRLPLDEDQRQRLAADLAKVEGLETSEVLSDLALEFDDSQQDDDDEDDVSLGSDNIEGFLSPDDDFFSVDAPASFESSDESKDESSDLESGTIEPAVPSLTFDSTVTQPMGQDAELPAFLQVNTPPSDADEGDRSITLEGFSDEIAVPPSSEPSPDTETVQDLFGESSDSSVDHGASDDETVEDLFGSPESEPASVPTEAPPTATPSTEASSTEAPSLEAPTESETLDDVFGNAGQDSSADGSPIDMTVDSLFTSIGESESNQVEGDNPLNSLASDSFDEDSFNADDELRGIFEDLQTLDDIDVETSQAQEEKTLMDLMKGLNQPSLPTDDADDSEAASIDTNTSWSIFDDVNDVRSESEADKKKIN